MSDLEQLAALIELLESADFTDFQYDKARFHLTVRRGSPRARTFDERAPAGIDRVAVAAEPRVSAPIRLAVEPEDTDAIVVRAPLFGAFYGAPKPGDPPFVQIGSVVEPDTVLCIIEVMKLMNSVTAGTAGEITGIYPQNGDMVEVDQALFAIRRVA